MKTETFFHKKNSIFKIEYFLAPLICIKRSPNPRKHRYLHKNCEKSSKIPWNDQKTLKSNSLWRHFLRVTKKAIAVKKYHPTARNTIVNINHKTEIKECLGVDNFWFALFFSKSSFRKQYRCIVILLTNKLWFWWNQKFLLLVFNSNHGTNFFTTFFVIANFLELLFLKPCTAVHTKT